MLIQEKIIDIIKNKCIHDNSISACMMYGSFTKGQGDQYSDVEFYIFIANDVVDRFDSKRWISKVYPVDLIFYNEYRTEVAIFSNMIRGEFHFLPDSEMEIIKSFKRTGVFPDIESMYIYDSTERLMPLLVGLSGSGPDRMTDENVNFAFNNFVNAWLMGVNVMKRGELARSLEGLIHVQKYILQLIRIHEKNVEHWLNSTKNLEADISPNSYKDYVSFTSKLDKNELNHAYMNTLKKIEELYNALNSHYSIDVDGKFIRKLFSYINQ
ncbi:nucleotidyltransferase domain-containing protein [Cytobacillus praedii]|uniref:Nucleotidyltransferase domain-containing protein n=1 Tax=Cytobacillus praedii TaxID=1742358 RepID=A0A4V2NTU4_9BACI|nr:nucleotidyltransferase domain-containing protein [Cytobacillus praedii]TCJ01672.1 nucleotidyltransferase domain-containing protein [Cytobacillus praedii]